MDPITGAVIIAGLKYVGQPSAELVKDFISRILTPTGEAIGQVAATPIVEWQRRRVERANDTVARAATIVAGSGVDPQPVSGQILMPLIEKASLVDDEELRTRWASLLANAATDAQMVLPAFITILGELSPLEAKLLNRLAHLRAEEWFLKKKQKDAPALGQWKSVSQIKKEFRLPALAKYLEMDSDGGHIVILIANLKRLALVETELRDGEMHARLSPFGKAFIQACSTNVRIATKRNSG